MVRLAAFFAAALSAFAEVSIRHDFEGGSAGAVERVSDRHYRVAAAGETDQDGRNRQANWYYLRVEGAPRGTLTIDLVNLPGEYNYHPNRGAVTKDTPPVISYDNESWTHVADYEYDAAEPKLRLRIAAQRPVFWIAHTPPYTNEHLDRLRSFAVGETRFGEQVIGKSAGGRNLLLWTLGDATDTAKTTVWLMFRQHSWESGSSWVGEGVVRALLEPNARALRRRFVWKILPMCDPDGVARGGVRYNARGYDLNRNWDTVDPRLMPEIAAQRQAVQEWVRSGRRIGLFLSLHNTETSEYLEGPPGGEDSPALRALAERLFHHLQARTTFHPSRPLFYAEETTTAGKPGRMTVTQGLARDFGIPAFLMEQRVAFHPRLKRLPTVDDRLRFGRDLVHAIAAALTRN